MCTSEHDEMAGFAGDYVREEERQEETRGNEMEQDVEVESDLLPLATTQQSAILPWHERKGIVFANILKPIVHFLLSSVNQLLADLKLVRIGRQIENVQAAEQVQDLTTADDLSIALKTLNGMDTSSVVEDHNSELAQFNIHEVVECSATITVIRAHCNHNDTRSNLYRQRVMLSQSYLAGVVASLISQCTPVILSEPKKFQNMNHWFVHLTFNICNALQSNEELSLESSEYIPSSCLPSVTFTEVPFHGTYPLTLTDVAQLVPIYTARTLQCWFNMPVPFISQARATLVTHLIEYLGPGSFLIPAIWSAYDELPSWLFNPKTNRAGDTPMGQTVTFEPASLSSFLSRLQQIASPDICLHLSKLQDQYTALYPSEESIQSHLLMLLNDSIMVCSSRQPMFSSEFSKNGFQPPAVRNDQIIPLQNGTSQLFRTKRCVIPMLHDAKIVANLIAISINALENSINLQAPPGLHAVQKVMLENSDIMLPLREQAIGRMYMNAGLDHNFARTREGLFSMMIFRFITFNSRAFIFCPQHL